MDDEAGRVMHVNDDDDAALQIKRGMRG